MTVKNIQMNNSNVKNPPLVNSLNAKAENVFSKNNEKSADKVSTPNFLYKFSIVDYSVKLDKLMSICRYIAAPKIIGLAVLAKPKLDWVIINRKLNNPIAKSVDLVRFGNNLDLATLPEDILLALKYETSRMNEELANDSAETVLFNSVYKPEVSKNIIRVYKRNEDQLITSNETAWNLNGSIGSFYLLNRKMIAEAYLSVVSSNYPLEMVEEAIRLNKSKNKQTKVFNVAKSIDWEQIKESLSENATIEDLANILRNTTITLTKNSLSNFDKSIRMFVYKLKNNLDHGNFSDFSPKTLQANLDKFTTMPEGLKAKFEVFINQSISEDEYKEYFETNIIPSLNLLKSTPKAETSSSESETRTLTEAEVETALKYLKNIYAYYIFDAFASNTKSYYDTIVDLVKQEQDTNANIRDAISQIPAEYGLDPMVVKREVQSGQISSINFIKSLMARVKEFLKSVYSADGASWNDETLFSQLTNNGLSNIVDLEVAFTHGSYTTTNKTIAYHTVTTFVNVNTKSSIFNPSNAVLIVRDLKTNKPKVMLDENNQIVTYQDASGEAKERLQVVFGNKNAYDSYFRIDQLATPSKKPNADGSVTTVYDVNLSALEAELAGKSDEQQKIIKTKIYNEWTDKLYQVENKKTAYRTKNYFELTSYYTDAANYIKENNLVSANSEELNHQILAGAISEEDDVADEETTETEAVETSSATWVDDIE